MRLASHTHGSVIPWNTFNFIFIIFLLQDHIFQCSQVVFVCKSAPRDIQLTNSLMVCSSKKKLFFK